MKSSYNEKDIIASQLGKRIKNSKNNTYRDEFLLLLSFHISQYRFQGSLHLESMQQVLTEKAEEKSSLWSEDWERSPRERATFYFSKPYLRQAQVRKWHSHGSGNSRSSGGISSSSYSSRFFAVSFLLLLFPEVDTVSGNSLSCMDNKTMVFRKSHETKPTGVRDYGEIHRKWQLDPLNLYVKSWVHHELCMHRTRS